MNNVERIKKGVFQTLILTVLHAYCVAKIYDLGYEILENICGLCGLGIVF